MLLSLYSSRFRHDGAYRDENVQIMLTFAETIAFPLRSHCFAATSDRCVPSQSSNAIMRFVFRVSFVSCSVRQQSSGKPVASKYTVVQTKYETVFRVYQIFWFEMTVSLYIGSNWCFNAILQFPYVTYRNNYNSVIVCSIDFFLEGKSQRNFVYQVCLPEVRFYIHKWVSSRF